MLLGSTLCWITNRHKWSRGFVRTVERTDLTIGETIGQKRKIKICARCGAMQDVKVRAPKEPA